MGVIINMKKIFLIFCFSFTYIICIAQTNRDTTIYFNLSDVKYDRHESNNHIAFIKTKRRVHEYGFTISCKCMHGHSISFSGHDNFETGSIFDSVKIINRKAYKTIRFMPFDSMINFLEKYQYKRKAKLYFVEIRKKKYFVYNVELQGSFGTE